VDEFIDIQEITYDKKMKDVMRRKIKKRKITLNKTLLITREEMLFDKENYNMTELIREGMDITDTTLDRGERDEREVASMKK
jgi:hypothetical protein